MTFQVTENQWKPLQCFYFKKVGRKEISAKNVDRMTLKSILNLDRQTFFSVYRSFFLPLFCYLFLSSANYFSLTLFLTFTFSLSLPLLKSLILYVSFSHSFSLFFSLTLTHSFSLFFSISFYYISLTLFLCLSLSSFLFLSRAYCRSHILDAI